MPDPSGFWRVDLHAHTAYSSDGSTELPDFLRAAHRAGLQRIAVTDHNTIRGALEAARMEPEFVIPGEEIKTAQGELLGFFVREEVPRGLAPEEAVARLRDQGAVISVSHPFDRLRSGAWKEADLLRILPLVDAVETFNARCLFPGDNRRIAALARARNLAGTAGSDGHAALELGTAGVELPPFHDAESFRAALAAARPFGHLSPWWVHFISTYAKWRKRITGLGRSSQG